MQTSQPGPASFPTPPRPDRRRRRTTSGLWMLVAGIAVGALLAGLGVAGARTSSHPGSPVAHSAPRWVGPDWMEYAHFVHSHFGHMHGDHRKLFGRRPGEPSLHGRFTVPIPGRGSRTLVFQRGSVASVSGSSIGVKSDDGYTASYALDDRTLVLAGLHGIGSVKPGDVVGVFGVKTGSSTRVVRVFDETALSRVRGGLFPGKPDHAREMFPG